MASLSLPRVLHPRKTSLEIERENFEKAQATAIGKAINNVEMPVKQKHVRFAIIGTFQEQGAQTFWAVVLRLPYLDDRIVAWKLCHVVHKVLREGHPLCLVHSQRHRRELDESGKLWCHLKEGYGKMIRLYTSLLMTKLDFHKRNPRFPGHLGVTNDELSSIGANDINNYFQLAVEMFDYLDGILELQAAIFGSLDMSRSNSMTSAGQCRLAPLIMCIQDASRLYDYCVKILFRLHSSLPADILTGHRDRFLKQFKELKHFYQNTNALQYFRNLITVPPLPERPPNFLLQAELGTYVTQVVVVPSEEEEFAEGNLIDTSEDTLSDRVDSHSQASLSPPVPPPQVPPPQVHVDAIAERDNLIRHLQQELERLRIDINVVIKDNMESTHSLKDQIMSLETSLATRDSELVQERQIKEDLFQQVSAVTLSQDSEQKAKDEKFTKLVGIYKNLREEHIDLIRQKAEVEKKLKETDNKCEEVEKQAIAYQSQLKEMEFEHTKKEEQVQQSSLAQFEELESLKRDKDLFNMEIEILRRGVKDAITERDACKSKLESEILQKQQLQAAYQSQLKEMEFEHTKKEEKVQQSSLAQLEELESLKRDKDLCNMEIEILRKRVEDAIAERDVCKSKIESEILQKQQLQVAYQSQLKEMEFEHTKKEEQVQQSSLAQLEELESLKRDKHLCNMEIEILRKGVEDAITERDACKSKIESEILQKQQLQEKVKQLSHNLSAVQSSILQLNFDNANQLKKIITKCVHENQISMKHAIDELDNPALAALSCSPDYFRTLTNECSEVLNCAITVSHTEPADVIMLANKISHTLASYLLQGRATSNTSPDIMFGDRMADVCKELGESVLVVLEGLKTNNVDVVSIDVATEKLRAVASLSETISGSLQGESAEKLVDMIDDELAAMDKAIEEAANRIQEMLSKSRAADSGIKLEVNEKILDSCTTLMQAIKLLVQKSRLLQAEIVAQGKGTASAKEFYKRNHRWTDGFISAAKAVAVGAKFFLSAADKVVNGQGKLEQLVVASQEIAASTAQLVVASRVKADRHSVNLQQLGQASKSVTTATGGVVATVKDCSQLMDDAEELDTSNMTLHQAKRSEMEAQVKVLELEKDLDKERLRLSALRRHHYQLAGEGEGWEQNNHH